MKDFGGRGQETSQRLLTSNNPTTAPEVRRQEGAAGLRPHRACSEVCVDVPLGCALSTPIHRLAEQGRGYCGHQRKYEFSFLAASCSPKYYRLTFLSTCLQASLAYPTSLSPGALIPPTSFSWSFCGDTLDLHTAALMSLTRTSASTIPYFLSCSPHRSPGWDL